MALFIGGPRHGARSSDEMEEKVRLGETIYTRMYVVHYRREGLWRVTAYASSDAFRSGEVFEQEWNDLLGKGVIDEEIRGCCW